MNDLFGCGYVAKMIDVMPGLCLRQWIELTMKNLFGYGYEAKMIEMVEIV